MEEKFNNWIKRLLTENLFETKIRMSNQDDFIYFWDTDGNVDVFDKKALNDGKGCYIWMKSGK